MWSALLAPRQVRNPIGGHSLPPVSYCDFGSRVGGWVPHHMCQVLADVSWSAAGEDGRMVFAVGSTQVCIISTKIVQ